MPDATERVGCVSTSGTQSCRNRWIVGFRAGEGHVRTSNGECEVWSVWMVVKIFLYWSMEKEYEDQCEVD